MITQIFINLGFNLYEWKRFVEIVMIEEFKCGLEVLNKNEQYE